MDASRETGEHAVTQGIRPTWHSAAQKPAHNRATIRTYCAGCVAAKSTAEKPADRGESEAGVLS